MLTQHTFVPNEQTDIIFRGLRKNARTAVFIDEANIRNTERALRFNLDFIKLRQAFEHYTDISSLNYFVVSPSSENRRDASSQQKFYEWMEFNEYRVHYKPSSLRSDDDGVSVNKTNVDSELITEAMRLVFSDRSISQIILMSGDGDYISMIAALQPLARCIVISSEKPAPVHLSRGLKKKCDCFIDLADMKPYLAHNRKARNLEGKTDVASATEHTTEIAPAIIGAESTVPAATSIGAG